VKSAKEFETLRKIIGNNFKLKYEIIWHYNCCENRKLPVEETINLLLSHCCIEFQNKVLNDTWIFNDYMK